MQAEPLQQFNASGFLRKHIGLVKSPDSLIAFPLDAFLVHYNNSHFHCVWPTWRDCYAGNHKPKWY